MPVPAAPVLLLVGASTGKARGSPLLLPLLPRLKSMLALVGSAELRVASCPSLPCHWLMLLLPLLLPTGSCLLILRDPSLLVASAQLLARCRALLLQLPTGTTKSTIVAGHMKESTESIPVASVGNVGSELNLPKDIMLAVVPRPVAMDGFVLRSSPPAVVLVVAALGAGSSMLLATQKASLLSQLPSLLSAAACNMPGGIADGSCAPSGSCSSAVDATLDDCMSGMPRNAELCLPQPAMRRAAEGCGVGAATPKGLLLSKLSG